MADQVQPLVNPRELDSFLGDERDVKAALVYARPFAKAEPIKDRGEAGQVSDAIKGLKDSLKAADKHRLEATEPYRVTTEAINAEYGELKTTTSAAIKALEGRALSFAKAERKRIADESRAEQERIDREAEAAAADAQAAAELAEAEPENPEAQKLAGEAHQDAVAAAVVAPPPPVDPPKHLRGDFSSLGSAVTYKHQVTDFSQLPEEHKAPNDRTLKAAIKGEKAMAKAQGREFNLQLIPGVRIWPEESGVSR